MTPKLDIVKSESLKEESLEDIVSGSELLPKLKPSLIEVEEDSVDVETVGEQMPGIIQISVKDKYFNTVKYVF